MKENEDRKLEKLMDHIMKDAVLDSPSFDFTSKVMSQALATDNIGIMVYKPLIPKSVFIGVLGCFIALSVYLLNTTETQTNNWLFIINFDSISNSISTSVFKFSKITTYTVVFATLILFIQIYFLKNYFDKKLDNQTFI